MDKIAEGKKETLLFRDMPLESEWSFSFPRRFNMSSPLLSIDTDVHGRWLVEPKPAGL